MITIPGKIPITIQPLFWLMGFLIGWLWTSTLTGALLALVVITFSVLFHEWGHAVTALLFGQTPRIELAAFGGFTYRTGRKLRLWEEFIIVLNGPLAGLFLAIVAYFVLLFFAATITNTYLLFLLRFTFVANLFWTIINLLPVLPLDGGHLMSIIFESLFGFKGVKMAIVVGLIIALAISTFFFAIRQFLAGALFLIFAFESMRSLRYYKIFNEKDRDQDLQKILQDADRDRQAGATERALAGYTKVRERADGGILHMMATEGMAQIYKEKHSYEKAYEILLPLQKELSSQSIPLLHYLAFINGDLTTTLKVGNQAYQSNPSYETALINACAHGKLAHVKEAVGWLERCVRDQIPDPSEVLSRSEFDPIRESTAFREFQAKVS